MTAHASSKASTPSVPVKPQKAPPRFPCSHCDKVFKRSEHRARHERSRMQPSRVRCRDDGADMIPDTKEKPFHCRYCGRRYARKFVQIVPDMSQDILTVGLPYTETWSIATRSRSIPTQTASTWQKECLLSTTGTILPCPSNPICRPLRRKRLKPSLRRHTLKCILHGTTNTTQSRPSRC